MHHPRLRIYDTPWFCPKYIEEFKIPSALLGCQSRSNKNFLKESVLRKCSRSPLTASVFLILKFQYKMDPAQMKFLRLLSMRITQNITYHCYNSRAWEEEDDRTIKLQGDNDMELTSSEKTKPKVVSDNCDVSIPRLFLDRNFSSTRMRAQLRD